MALTGLSVGYDAGKINHADTILQAKILNPKNQVPISFIIDDSTTLVNMAYYGIPQFHEVFPDRYPQDWRKLPQEIPDDFVREFGDYCQEHGVKGKYSIVPYPACTGWVDRFIPGWSKSELQVSLKLVRDFMQPNWDIHPEMISHTRVIDIKTGRPYPYANPAFMENWGWSQDKRADEMGEYMAYALQILKNVDLDCTGITTPGGFANQNKENLAQGTLSAIQEVYGHSVAHYFRDLYTDPSQSVAPLVKYPEDLHSDHPKCVVSIIGCTGDWFGGWDGLNEGSVDQFITSDLSGGRMVEVIESGEPALMVCHWPGIYYNGEKRGFKIFQEVVHRLELKYGQLNWMKNSEIAQYWAAKELTELSASANAIRLNAPFSAHNFTIQIQNSSQKNLILKNKGNKIPLRRLKMSEKLEEGTYHQQNNQLVVCFNLEKGNSELSMV